jgi:hypothetical protein
MDDLPIVAAGREVPMALDRIRRYCGLRWSGGPPETWAWHYYDMVPTAYDDLVTAVDVLCAASLHPGLSRTDLTYFRERGDDVTAWLRDAPPGLTLFEASDGDVEHIAALPEVLPDLSISLLSKVLHRKRPHLIPLLDRHIIDWYRPLTGKRAAAEAWPPLVRSLRSEELDLERRHLMSTALNRIEDALWPAMDREDRPGLSWIRAIDIAIWMGSR